MPDIASTYHIDFSTILAGFAAVEKAGTQAAKAISSNPPAFRGQVASAHQASEAFAGVKRQSDQVAISAAKSSSTAARFFATVKRGATAAAGVAAITTALVILNRRFPVIGEVASKTFSLLKTGTREAAVQTTKFVGILENVKRAAQVSVGVWALVKAFRALKGAAPGEIKLPKAPKLPGGGAMRGLSKVAAPLAAAGLGVAVFAAVKDGFTRAVTQAADREQVQISFEVLTGGPEQAKAVLGELRDLAEDTPLRFADLSGAGRQLLAFKESAETLPATLQRIGDVSLGIGAPIREIADLYGKARVQGTLFAEDINQLTGRGIDVISEFATQLGVGTDQVKKMASQGQITFPMLEEAFRSLTSEGGSFFGMMERQSKTVSGLWSTLNDRISGAFTALGSPINDAIRPLLSKAVELAGGLKDRAAAIGQEIAGAIDLVHAMFTTLSRSEIFSAIGMGLSLAFMKAIDVLARGLQAIYAASQDAGFMDGLGEKMRSIGVLLKDALLGAVQAMLFALSQIKGLGFLHEGASNILATRNEDRIKEANRDRKAPPAAADLLAAIQAKFEGATGIFTGSIAKTQSELDQLLAPVYAEVSRMQLERGSESAGGGGATARGGEVVAAAGGSALAGAFQQAKNLISGKTINEVVAQETKKQTDQIGKVVTAQQAMTRAIGRVEDAVKKDKNHVNVEVVPAF